MSYNPIVIPSKHIYGSPKLLTKNNVIRSVSAVEQKVELEKNNNFFSVDFMLYTSNTENPTYNLNDYTDYTMDNQVKPYESNGIVLYPQATDSNYKSYFIYIKETFKNELLSLYDNLSVDIEHEGTNEILNAGIKTFTYKANITSQNSTNNYKIEKYVSINAFENESFNIISAPPADRQLASVKDFNGYVKCGVVFDTDNITVCAIIKAYESSYSSLVGTTSYYRIQQKYILDFYIDNYKTKETTKTFGEQENIDILIESNELTQENTKISKLPYNYINAISYGVGASYNILVAEATYPVESDLTIQVTTNGGNHTLIIEQGAKLSNQIEIGLGENEVVNISITPKFDDKYYYDESFYYDDSNFVSIGEYIANNIIQNYTNGKKTMSLEAGYGDYYYADGTPYGGVAGKKMLLQVGDIVQPMRWDGSKDVPYSLDIHGNSRVFEITSAELNVGGAPKLYLELLEKTT